MAIIEVKNLTFSYPQEQPAIKNISFIAKQNEVLGIIGPSGCGKSTLLLALCGLIPHSVQGKTQGTVILTGKDTRKSKPSELAKTAQILFQSPESQLFALNVEDEIAFGLENQNIPWTEIEKRTKSILKEMNIEKLSQNSLEELSSGQKQRVALASVLALKPKILLFDEPTANLDQKAICALIKTIQKLKKTTTILIVEHNIEFVQKLADKLLLIDKGELIAQGSTTQVLQSKEYQKIMLPAHNQQKIISKIAQLSKQSKEKPLLEIKNLNYTYPNNKKALKQISLSIRKGEFIGILGANGSGKSTLALNIIGLLQGTGSITLSGKEISKQPTEQRAKNIGYVFQNPNYQLFEQTVKEEIGFGAKNIELNETEITKRVQKALEITGLEDVTDRDPHALSVGQKRRVTIASVLVMNSEIIIVDEPDTGLDHKTAREIMNRLKELNTQGKTIILISHSLELVAEYCTRAIGMKEGNIVSLKEVLKDYLPDETLTY